MNRDEFMQQLARLLSDLPESERMEAIRYYNDYFDEAGIENESNVIQELVSPEKVAAFIKADLKENAGENSFEQRVNNAGTDKATDWGAGNQQQTESTGWNTENQQQTENTGWNTENQQQTESTGWNTGNQQQTESTGWNTGNQQQTGYTGWNTGNWQWTENNRRNTSLNKSVQGQNRRSGRGVGSWALVIILLVFMSPLILGVGGGILGALVGIVAALFGVWISVFAAGAGLFFGGLTLVFKGIFKLWSVPASGMVSIGGGLLSVSLGIFLLIFFAWLTFRLLPRLCRAIVNFISRLLRKRKGAAV